VGSPRTLRDLRAAVARVLVARGEAADALVVVCNGQRVEIYVVACAMAGDWIDVTAPRRADACAEAWAAVVRDLHYELRSARASVAGCRSDATRDAARERLRRARAAVEAAQAVEAQWLEDNGGGDR
jgi:hypothetical protein